MNMDTPRDDEHERALSDLPWYVNGTLDERSTLRTERHLARCASCERELEMLTRVAGCIGESPVVEQSPRSSLDSVLRRIDAHEQRQERRQKWLGAIGRMTRGLRSRSLALAVAAQALVILILVAALLEATRIPAGSYRTLSSGQASAVAGIEIRVVLAEHITMGGLRSVLDELDAEITAGPSRTGVLTLDVARNPVDPQGERAVARLRSYEGVRFAEVVGAAAHNVETPR
jgi:hypothetical protein